MQQFQLNPGFAHQQGEGARAWADVRAGVAAVIHGPRATECAGALFSGLAIVALEPGGVASGNYPPRVIGAARHLESLHRTLWEQGGATQGGLGVGVAVLDGEHVYFLQVGPSRLYHVTGAVCQEAAPSDHTGSLLGAAVKSGIRVHTAHVARHDRIVVVSGDLVAVPGGESIARMVGGDLRGVGPALLDVFGSSGHGAVAAVEICLEADIRPVAPILPISAEFEAPTQTLAPPAATAPPAPDTPAPTPPAESPAAAPSGGEWDFHNDVVQDLADFMSELQSDPGATSAPPGPGSSSAPAASPPVPLKPAQVAPPPTPAPRSQATPPEMPQAPVPPPVMPTQATPPPATPSSSAQPPAAPDPPDGIDMPTPEPVTPPEAPSAPEAMPPSETPTGESPPGPPTPEAPEPRFSWSDEPGPTGDHEAVSPTQAESRDDLAIVPPTRDPILNPHVGESEDGEPGSDAPPPSDHISTPTVEMETPDFSSLERLSDPDDVPEEPLLEGPLATSMPGPGGAAEKGSDSSPESPSLPGGITLENLAGGEGSEDEGGLVSGVFKIKPQAEALDEANPVEAESSEAAPMGPIAAMPDEPQPGTPSLTGSFAEEAREESDADPMAAEPLSVDSLTPNPAGEVSPLVVSGDDVPAETAPEEVWDEETEATTEPVQEQRVLPDDDAEPVWDEEVMAGGGSGGRRSKARTSYRLAILTLIVIAIPVVWFFGKPLLTSLTGGEQTQTTEEKDGRPSPSRAEADAIEAVGSAVDRPQEVAMGEGSGSGEEQDTPTEGADTDATDENAATDSDEGAAAKDTGDAEPAPEAKKVAAAAEASPTTAPAPPPEPKLVAVAIAGPKGGTVTLDGKELQEHTPITSVDLKPGEHAITVTYGRLGRWSGKVKVSRAGQTIDVSPKGKLTFASSERTPTGTVSIDGKAVGSPPLKEVTVPAGEHLVEFEGQGVSGFRQQVFVAGGAKTVVALPIVPEGEALVIAESRKFVGDGFDDAEGDSIFVDRKFAGLTPNDITVSPGVHSVRLASQTGESIVRMADLAPGAVRVIRGDFGSSPRARVLPRPQPSDLGPGDPFLLSARVIENDVPAVEKVSCNVRTKRDAPFQTRVMRRVQSDDPYWVVLIRGAETEGGFLQYYFSATDADGAELVSEIYALTFDSVASNGVQVATGRN